jgi:hypothetical protein
MASSSTRYMKRPGDGRASTPQNRCGKCGIRSQMPETESAGTAREVENATKSSRRPEGLRSGQCCGPRRGPVGGNRPGPGTRRGLRAARGQAACTCGTQTGLRTVLAFRSNVLRTGSFESVGCSAVPPLSDASRLLTNRHEPGDGPAAPSFPLDFPNRNHSRSTVLVLTATSPSPEPDADRGPVEFPPDKTA